LKFFNFVHRSIFDSSFYKEVASFSRKTVVLYFIKLLFFTVLITGLAHTYYLLHPQRGISSKIELLFSGMEINEGVLIPNRETPYFPPSYLMNPVIEQFTGSANVLNNSIDSLLVIDTLESSTLSPKIPYVLKKDRVMLRYNNVVFNIPYRDFLKDIKHFRFTSGEIRQLLGQNLEFLLTSCLTVSFFSNFFLLIFSIFFLGIAAFIFRVERGKKFLFYIRNACFAVTPIAVGTILIGLSGVKLAWTWHVLIFISTVVMFRAIVALTKPANDNREI
jgi:hypothetical protein